MNRMKASPAFIKILFALFTALLVVVLGYLCIQIYTIFHRTYKTETAIAYTMSDNITLKGVAVFQAVDVPGSGNLGYVVQDGERVSAGTILAEQYTDDSQGAMRERLDRLDRAILLLTKSENSSGSDLSVLTTRTAHGPDRHSILRRNSGCCGRFFAGAK